LDLGIGDWGLANLNLSSFNLKNLKNKKNMFLECDNLDNIIVNNILYEQIGHEINKFNVTLIYLE
jgi:hypothetical protein